MLYSRALGDTLGYFMRIDPRVVLIGEDILDPYGGAFKVTRGLSTEFSGRVFTTPVSEAAITGIAGGLALIGCRPIVEYMFGDFVGLGLDQILNHIVKYEKMYDGGITCPVILRVPSGGGRGYGPTHSQSLEKHFLGIPNLRVVAASLYAHPRHAFETFLSEDKPVMFVEHKLLYARHLELPNSGSPRNLLTRQEGSGNRLPTLGLSAVPPDECSVSVTCYGYQAMRMAALIEPLAIEQELFVDLLVPQELSDFDYAPLQASVERTGALITVEESTAGWGWGSQIAAEMQRRLHRQLRHPIECVTSQPDIIPSGMELEREMLVSVEQIRSAVQRLAV